MIIRVIINITWTMYPFGEAEYRDAHSQYLEEYNFLLLKRTHFRWKIHKKKKKNGFRTHGVMC